MTKQHFGGEREMQEIQTKKVQPALLTGYREEDSWKLLDPHLMAGLNETL